MTMTKPTKAWYRQQAQAQCHESGVVEVAANAPVSMSKHGAYVQAWVWIPHPDNEEDQEEAAFMATVNAVDELAKRKHPLRE